MVITAISGIETLRQLDLLGKFQGCKVPNRMGVTSALKSDCQRLSRVLLLSGIERKQSKLPFESPTMVNPLNPNLDCNKTINQFGVE